MHLRIAISLLFPSFSVLSASSFSIESNEEQAKD